MLRCTAKGSDMSAPMMTAGTHVGDHAHGHGISLLTIIADWRAARARRAEARRLCEQLDAMDDRMLLDIGMSENDIARLRNGDQFVPTLVRMVSNGVGFSA